VSSRRGPTTATATYREFANEKTNVAGEVKRMKRIGQPAATPGVCTCVNCTALAISQKEEQVKVSTNQKSHFVSTANFSHLGGVKRATSPFPDGRLADLGADGKSDGMPLRNADDDQGIPKSSDASVWAHAKRAANCLEAAMYDPDNVDMERIQQAREHLARCCEKHFVR